MIDKTFIRVESESGVGAYSFDFISNVFGGHPLPHEDSPRLAKAFEKMGEAAIFGFKSIQSFENWFTSELLDKCIENEEIDFDLFVCTYEVDNRFDGYMQSITNSNRPRKLQSKVKLFEYYL